MLPPETISSAVSRLARIIGWLLFFLFLGWLVATVIFPEYSDSHMRRAAEGNNLRAIGSAMIAHGQKHGALSPDALRDSYTLAAELARDGWLTEPSLWYSQIDPAYDLYQPSPGSIVNRDNPAMINPKFQGSPLAFAVLLWPDVTRLPPKTPIAWTRGLQPDGTWREDSPYYGTGGHIVFADGALQLYMVGVDRALTKWGTDQPTGNILEALPPGSRVGEYVPPPEVLAHAYTMAPQDKMHPRTKLMRLAPIALAGLIFLLVLACAVAITAPRYGNSVHIGLFLAGVILGTGFWAVLSPDFWGHGFRF